MSIKSVYPVFFLSHLLGWRLSDSAGNCWSVRRDAECDCCWWCLSLVTLHQALHVTWVIKRWQYVCDLSFCQKYSRIACILCVLFTHTHTQSFYSPKNWQTKKVKVDKIPGTVPLRQRKCSTRDYCNRLLNTRTIFTQGSCHSVLMF